MNKLKLVLFLLLTPISFISGADSAVMYLEKASVINAEVVRSLFPEFPETANKIINMIDRIASNEHEKNELYKAMVKIIRTLAENTDQSILLKAYIDDTFDTINNKTDYAAAITDMLSKIFEESDEKEEFESFSPEESRLFIQKMLGEAAFAKLQAAIEAHSPSKDDHYAQISGMLVRNPRESLKKYIRAVNENFENINSEEELEDALNTLFEAVF